MAQQRFFKDTKEIWSNEYFSGLHGVVKLPIYVEVQRISRLTEPLFRIDLTKIDENAFRDPTVANRCVEIVIITPAKKAYLLHVTSGDILNFNVLKEFVSKIDEIEKSYFYFSGSKHLFDRIHNLLGEFVNETNHQVLGDSSDERTSKNVEIFKDHILLRQQEAQNIKEFLYYFKNVPILSNIFTERPYIAEID